MDATGERGLPESAICWRKANDPAGSDGRFPPVAPCTEVRNGVRCDRDVQVKLRDGITVYVDLYQAAGEVIPQPAILSWGTSGKRAGYVAGGGPNREVPPGTCSPATMFEGPDPDYWCRRGYAVVNVDPPGIGNSEGDANYSGRAEGLDCADVIEWAAGQSWCDGNVGMAGNSYFAMVQLFAAAERPPHLRAIAPWEARTDLYRQMACQGGIPEVGFMSIVRDRVFGRGLSQDLVSTLEEHPFYDEVWEEKTVDLPAITVPTYLTASWSHFNLLGSLAAFRGIGTSAKWIRVYRDFEWPEAYRPEHLAELNLFFDRYLKGLHNGWELTPPVRLDVMDAGDIDIVHKREEREFPLARTVYTAYYADASDGSLRTAPVERAASVDYDADSGEATFDLRFDEQIEITGYIKVRLWVEAIGSDDVDLFVLVTKLGADGQPRPTLVLGRPHPGAWGRLRASHRQIDEAKSGVAEPYHQHRRELRLNEGEIVPVDVAIWPTSRVWYPRETLRIRVAGHYIRDEEWFEPFAFDTRNRGRHVLHTGGPYDASVTLPFIPAVPPVIASDRNARSRIPLSAPEPHAEIVRRPVIRPVAR